MDLSWRETIVILYDFLKEAQQQRDKRKELINGEFGWVPFEREIMLQVVNELRKDKNKNPINLENIKAAENYAKSDCDYNWNFAIGCTKLVYDVNL